MSFLGNLLWVIFGGGLVISLEYLFSGLLLMLTIVGIPFGLQVVKLSVLGLTPFGKEIINKQNASGFISVLMNIIWILVGGIWISLTHILWGILMAVTIIGIPFAKQHFKLAALAFSPFGKEIK